MLNLVVLLVTFGIWPVEAQVPSPAPGRSPDDGRLALELSLAFESWLERDRATRGGRFLLYDPDARQVLDLTSSKLDDGDHLHRLADGRFLSWGEFVDTAGHKYLIDFYFRRTGDLFVFDDEITIFSRDGVKRYEWDESGPTMKKNPLQ